MKFQHNLVSKFGMSAVIMLCSLLFSVESFSADPKLNWLTHETENFQIHYPKGLSSHVAKVALLSEQSHSALTPFFQWQPKKKTNVVLLDDFDQANGYASPMPNNTMTLFMQPPTQGELMLFDDWLRLLIHHEYTHILHVDKVMDTPAFFRKIFGRFILLFPNALQPNWFQEGLATYLEGDALTHVGRGESDYFQMLMRQEVKSGIKAISRINTVNAHEWPFNTAYLYGVYFFKFINDVYGEKAIQGLIDNYSENLIPYRVSSNPERVTGKSLEALWLEFSEYLVGYFDPQFKRLNQQNFSDFDVLAANHINFGSVAVHDKTLWYTASNEHDGAYLYQYDLEQKAEVKITDLNSAGALDVSNSGRVLISQLQNCGQHKIYYDAYLVQDKDTSVLERLTECGRYRQVRWLSDDTYIALAYENGIAKLDELSIKTGYLRTLWLGRKNEVVSSFDVNGAGDVIVSAKNNTEPWNIYLKKDISDDSDAIPVGLEAWRALTRDHQLQMWPVWHDGEIYFTQGNLAQFEIYKLLAVSDTDDYSKQRLSHNFSGVNQFSLMADNKAIAMRYSDTGFELVNMSLSKKPELYEKKWASSKVIKVPEQVISEQSYSPWPSLIPTYWMPLYLVNDDLSEMGFFTSGADALGIHQYQTSLSYEKETETPMLNMNYIFDNRYILGLNQILSTTSLLAQPGDLPVYQYESQWFFNITWPMLSMKSNYYPYLAYINHQSEFVLGGGLELTDNKSYEDNWLAAGLLFDGLSSSLSAGGFSDGFQFNSVIESADLAENSIIDGNVLNNQFRYFMPLGKGHVLAQKLFLGLTLDGNSQFELGGNASEAYVGPGFQFKKRSLALRGFDENIPELRAKNAAVHSLEYRLPFDWHDHASMVPPVGYSGWSVRGFMDNGWLWESDFDATDVYTGVGAELILDGSIAYYLNIRLRMGVAKGLHDLGSHSFYVQLGGSF